MITCYCAANFRRKGWIRCSKCISVRSSNKKHNDVSVGLRYGFGSSKEQVHPPILPRDVEFIVNQPTLYGNKLSTFATSCMIDRVNAIPLCSYSHIVFTYILPKRVLMSLQRLHFTSLRLESYTIVSGKLTGRRMTFMFIIWRLCCRTQKRSRYNFSRCNWWRWWCWWVDCGVILQLWTTVVVWWQFTSPAN